MKKLIPSIDERRREGEVEVKKPRNMPQLKVGQEVLVQNPKSEDKATSKRWESKGTIVKKRSRRSYIINIDGREYLRNRRFLKPYPEQDTPVLTQNEEHRESEESPQLTSILVKPDTPKPKDQQPQRKSHRERKQNVRFADYELY